jgi:NAD(P)-dependent dehydrogenase (short-subunit alcohol dehydrogenase family)
MAKTIFLTGASSGIGQATAELFADRGWNVVATMRTVGADRAASPNLLDLPLDVTKPETIQPAIDQAIERFGAIDALVNNAGYGLIGPFEACDPGEIERQFATNVFGLMAVTRAVLPHFRARNQGILVNVSSIGGRMAFPLYSPYHATKWAVDGWSDSLQYELRPFNIRVKIIEPGPIKTDFYGRSITVAQRAGLTAYDDYVAQVLPQLSGAEKGGSPPRVTAEVIYRSVTDNSSRLRYPAGGNAGLLLGLRKLLPDGLFQGLIRRIMER